MELGGDFVFFISKSNIWVTNTFKGNPEFAIHFVVKRQRSRRTSTQSGMRSQNTKKRRDCRIFKEYVIFIAAKSWMLADSGYDRPITKPLIFLDVFYADYEIRLLVHHLDSTRFSLLI